MVLQLCGLPTVSHWQSLVCMSHSGIHLQDVPFRTLLSTSAGWPHAAMRVCCAPVLVELLMCQNPAQTLVVCVPNLPAPFPQPNEQTKEREYISLPSGHSALSQTLPSILCFATVAALGPLGHAVPC